MPELSVGELADLLGARLEGDAARAIRGVAPLGTAGAGELTFLERESLISRLERSSPGAVLVREDVELPESDAVILRVDRPEAAFAQAIRLIHPSADSRPRIHSTAVIEQGVTLGSDVSVGAHAVVETGASIGEGTQIGPGAFVAGDAVVGRDCRVGHGVSLLSAARLGDRVVVHEGARIGTDGFGLATTAGGAVKVPQIGCCLIGDDVEIGANCTVDRGALVDTEIGARTKLDNLVHVGHNVRIGEDCVIVAQVGIAGSTTIDADVTLGGQAGVAGHLTIGAGARIGGQAGVFGDVPAGATYSGYPARPHRESLRASAATFRLPAALHRLAALERRMDDSGDRE